MSVPGECSRRLHELLPWPSQSPPSQSPALNISRATLTRVDKQQSKNLAGQIAFLKMMSTRYAGEIADDAVQILGGRGLTQSGMGKFVEMFQRTQKFDAILGGAEEVLGDLGVRQAMRDMPKDQRL